MRAALARLEETQAGCFPWKAGRSKLEQESHWGWQKVQPQYSSGMWEYSVCVCVTPKGRHWYAMIYIPERVFQISAPFHFLCVHDAGAGLWQELLTKAVHVSLMNERTFIQL